MINNQSLRLLALAGSITFVSMLTAVADSDSLPDVPLTNQPITVPNYSVAVSQSNIAPTPATQPPAKIQVYGEPRNSAGHPNTLVDSEDIERYKKLLKDENNADFQAAFKDVKVTSDNRLAQPIDVPIAQKGADGNWMWPGDFPKDVSPFNANNPTGKGADNPMARFFHTNGANAQSSQCLGMAYQLTGDQKYGEYVKKMLLAYADNYNNYGHPKGWTIDKYRSAQDFRMSDQFLDDGFYLVLFAYGYDLVHDLPSWTPAERAHVRDDFFKPLAAQFSDPHQGTPDYLSQTNNRSCLCTAGVLMAGYACEDQEMINNALYGTGGTKEAPKGGLIQVHFGDKCLLPDGLWVEGAPGYQLGIAGAGLFNDAETLWHHGIDMYRYRNGALKRMLDTSFALAYPNPTMTVAALHDSGQFGLLDSPGWLATEIGVSYELGYERYKDPRYVPIIRHAPQSLQVAAHTKGPSLFLDLPPKESDPAPTIENANFYSVGYGILRQPTPTGGNQLLMEYGTSYGHVHPSKLGIDVYALGKSLMPFPGVIFPYNHPLDWKWFGNSLSNCDLMVDQMSQVFSGNSFHHVRGSPVPVVEQLVFAPATTMGLQRAWSDTLNSKLWPNAMKQEVGVDIPEPPVNQICQDRSLFLTPEYLADIFGAFSVGPHRFDLAWHIIGDTRYSLKTEPYTFPDPVPNGYNALEKVGHATTDQAWTATVKTDNNQTVRFLAAGGTPTEVFTANRIAAVGLKDQSTPPVFFQRRDAQNNVIFGNAVDLSGSADGYLKSVAQEGSLDTGYGLLKLVTVKGTDLCFTAFRPGSHTAGGLTTDAMQAMVRMDGTNVQAMYLGGGTTLKANGGTIQRSEPGLAYVEKMSDGNYVIGNPSPVKATVTVDIPALGGVKKLDLDAGGQWTNAKAETK